LNFKRITLLLTIILGLTVLYSGYKLINIDLFPWLNVLISSALSWFVFLISYLIKGKNKVVQLLLFTFFIVQLFLNYSILQNADILITSWRWLFYPLIFFVYILCFAAAIKKKNKLILLVLLFASFFSLIASILSIHSLWIPLQMLFYILFSIGIIVSKNSQKTKIIESL
jgi:hypothetical protein